MRAGGPAPAEGASTRSNARLRALCWGSSVPQIDAPARYKPVEEALQQPDPELYSRVIAERKRRSELLASARSDLPGIGARAGAAHAHL